MLDLTKLGNLGLRRLGCFLIFAPTPDGPNIDGGSGGGGGTGGGGGGGGTSGGGNPGTSTGTASVPSGIPVGENGGVYANTYYLLVPVQDSASNRCYVAFFDTTSFDDAVDGSSYSYRAEDVMLLRVPTVRRIGLVYRDLGPVSVTFMLKGTNDKGNVSMVTQKVKLGTTGASGALLTAFIDMVFTGFRPQLSLSRDAGAGPLSVVSVTLIGEVEDVSL